MFKLDPNPTFAATVQITLPGGGHRPLAVVFRHKTRSQLDKFVEDRAQSDLAMAEEIVEAVPDRAEGQTLQEFFAQLFENYPASALDLYFAYIRELRESRAKN